MFRTLISKKSLNGNIYTLTGEMEVEVADRKDSEGTFEVKYLVKDNDIYLESIIFDITKEY